jgi:hypothetical protein
MSSHSLYVPESIHRKLAEFALGKGTLQSPLIDTHVAEKLAALLAEEHAQQRATRASKAPPEGVPSSVIPKGIPVVSDEDPAEYCHWAKTKAG